MASIIQAILRCFFPFITLSGSVTQQETVTPLLSENSASEEVARRKKAEERIKNANIERYLDGKSPIGSFIRGTHDNMYRLGKPITFSDAWSGYPDITQNYQRTGNL